jgi:hypothetical protein
MTVTHAELARTWASALVPRIDWIDPEAGGSVRSQR